MPADATLAAQLVSSGVDWIVPDWPAPAAVRAFSTTRNGVGGRTVDFARGRDAEAGALLKSFLPGEPLWLAQTHGTAIASADVGHGRAPEADVAISRSPGKVCAVLAADCLPVLLADRRGSVVAAAHAGWRGLASGVLETAVGSMQTAPANVLAWLGPAIGPSAFEVGPDVHAAFCDRDAAADACFVVTRQGKWHADLYGLARLALGRAGLGAAAISGGGRCTYTERASFHSYRRGGPDRVARMATLIWLAPG